jgi:hypothetical protein
MDFGSAQPRVKITSTHHQMLMPTVTVEARHTNMKSDDMVGMYHSFPFQLVLKQSGMKLK